ncbi:MAG: hypothetical protein ACK5KP_06240 [Paludibacteraceae bacterium]
MRIIFLILIASVCALSVNAQTEVYFSADTAKVKSLQGVGIATRSTSYLRSIRSIDAYVEADYFYELRLADRVSLVFDAGLYRRYYTSDNVIVNQLYGLVGVSPRYYFSLSEQKSGRGVGLNAGWFVALPLRTSTDFILSDTYKWYGETFTLPAPKFGEIIKYSAGLNIGHRFALANRLFLEGAVGGQYQTYNFRRGEFYLSASLKVAYTF